MTTRPRIQPVPSPRSADALLRDLIARHAPAHQKLAAVLRRWLRKRLPSAHEIVYEYRDHVVTSWSPTERGYEGVLAVRASADGVRLYIQRGKGLPDPEKLLRGSGTQARWLQLEGASTLSRPEVARLVDEAIARSGVPFARSGRGLLVIRTTAAGQRRPRSG
jgi:hypothetical protein